MRVSKDEGKVVVSKDEGKVVISKDEGKVVASKDEGKVVVSKDEGKVVVSKEDTTTKRRQPLPLNVHQFNAYYMYSAMDGPGLISILAEVISRSY